MPSRSSISRRPSASYPKRDSTAVPAPAVRVPHGRSAAGTRRRAQWALPRLSRKHRGDSIRRVETVSQSRAFPRTVSSSDAVPLQIAAAAALGSPVARPSNDTAPPATSATERANSPSTRASGTRSLAMAAPLSSSRRLPLGRRRECHREEQRSVTIGIGRIHLDLELDPFDGEYEVGSRSRRTAPSSDGEALRADEVRVEAAGLVASAETGGIRSRVLGAVLDGRSFYLRSPR